MDKSAKIALLALLIIALIGGGVLIYFKGGLYKEKSVREGEKSFRDFGSVLESAASKHPKVLAWYEDMPSVNTQIIEESYRKLTEEQKKLVHDGFRKKEMNDFTKNLLSKMGYQSV